MSTVEIHLASGEVVTQGASLSRWGLSRRGALDLNREDAEPLTVDELLTEEHHRIYGRPWALGREYVDHLLTRELRTDLPLLDFGCGAGRVAIWLMPHLAPDTYCGIDSHLRSLWAFANYEVPLFGLAQYRPRLVLDNEFSVDCFGVEFDTVLDLYVSHHLGDEKAEIAYRRIREVMRTGGRVFLSETPKLAPDALRRVGFEISDVREVTYALLQGTEFRATDEWHELTAR